MNKKRILISGTVLITIGCGIFLVIMTNSKTVEVNNEPVTAVTEDKSAEGDISSVETQIDENDESSQKNSVIMPQNEVVKESPTLTDGQRKLISAVGLDPDNFTITAEMIVCAEAKIGAARVEEIKNGATPSFSEGVSLFSCYK